MLLLTGSSGFVGSCLMKYFEFKKINIYKRGSDFKIDSEYAIIHLAGMSHDLKKNSTYNEYYNVNTELTKKIFDEFLISNSKVFITLSSVKAVADSVEVEDAIPKPLTHYGRSKLLAEQYILSFPIPKEKRVYILRPCMIHGQGNKGNLNLLYSVISKGFPWPLGLFKNSRSYLSIENLCFIIKELIDRDDIPSGIYNVADDVPLSTNELIELIAKSNGNKVTILKLSKNFIRILARVGDFLKLPLNSERLQKLTENYVVSNAKIKKAIGKQLPVSSMEGLIKTFQSFSHNA